MSASDRKESSEALVVLKKLAEKINLGLEKVNDSTTDFTELNKDFNLFLEKLAVCDDLDDFLIQATEQIIRKISQSKIKVLSIILDPNVSSQGEQKGPDEEMIQTANKKNNAFLKKGLVVTSSLDFILGSSAAAAIISQIATKVTFICHWNTEENIPEVNDNSNKPGNNLIHKICPRLADMNLYPRLERLTILGCATASEDLQSTDLYICDHYNLDGMKKLSPPFYFCVLKNNKAVLFYSNENKIEQLAELTINTPKEAAYFSKWVQNLPLLWKKSLSTAKKMPIIMLEIHKSIFEHNRHTLIYFSSNLYAEKLLGEDKMVALYYKGESSVHQKKEAKTLFPSLKSSHLVFSADEEPRNLAMRAKLALKRKGVQVKGYSSGVVPAPSGYSVIPLFKSDIFGVSKGIIYNESEPEIKPPKLKS